MADFDFTDKASLDAFNTSIVEEFRSNAGVVGGPFEGATLLLLTSTYAPYEKMVRV
jgi:hypothetical protein